MALQVRELDKLIRHKLDAEAASAMAPIAIVNEAGRFLVSLRQWTFQLRPGAILALVGGAEYITLPTTFGAFGGEPVTHPSAARIRTLRFTNYADILDMRGTINPSNGVDGLYYGALVWVPNAASDGGPPTPRLEVWPTPTTTDTNAFLLPYYADWDERTTDEQFINVPEYAEGLVRHLVRETAAGYENDDQASVWDRQTEIMQSAMFQAVVAADTRAQSSLGQLKGGAAQTIASIRQSARTSPFYPSIIT